MQSFFSFRNSRTKARTGGIDFRADLRPTPIVLDQVVTAGSRRRDVVQLACGARHSLILCRDHSVFAFGPTADAGQRGSG